MTPPLDLNDPAANLTVRPPNTRDPLDVHVVVLLDHPPQHIVHTTILGLCQTTIVLYPERAVLAAPVHLLALLLLSV